MPFRLIPSVLLMLVLGALGQNAQAARAYFDGTFSSVQTLCPISNIAVVASQSFVGYFTDPNEPYPKTGEIAYVRAATANVSGCVNDVVGPEFFLPDGAITAISAANKVRCYLVNITNNNVIEVTDNPSGFQGGCSQTASSGTNGGLFYGYAVIASGWQFQVHVPVQFNKQLLGLAGPNTHRLGAIVSTTYGNAVPVQPVTVFYEADYLNTSVSGVTASGATLSTNLFSYFKGGQLYVDYGTTNAFGSSTTPANVADTSLNFPNVSANLTGLTPGTAYFARFRFVTNAGTFTSPTQTFTTSAAPNFALTVSKNGSGSGTVTSSPGGINCGQTCSANFAQGTSVTLTASASSGSVFAGWSGAGCSGTGTCTVGMSAAQNVTATFNTAPAANFTLTLSRAGSGSGSVSSSPAGINCGSTCSASFAANTVVTLTATPASGSAFAGWTNCAGPVGNSSCSVTMDAAKTVTATFNTAQSFGSLSLQVSGLPSGTSATLTLTGPGGFSQQRSILTGTGQTLSDVVTGDYTVTAPSVVAGGVTYNPAPASQTVTVTTGSVTASVAYAQAPAGTFALTVSKSGSGQGVVTSLPAGIDCGPTCSAPFGSGASVTLTPVPASGSVFAGWGGACSGSGTCTVTMNAAKTVTATFNTAPAGSFALSVSKSGAGAGTVGSTPAGINCGSTCTSSFASGTSVTLSASPDAGSAFAGWGGACGGAGTCTVTMDAAKSVSATFNPVSAANPPSLAASKPANAPQNASAPKGGRDVRALAFTLAPGASENSLLQSLTLQASGSGNDALDLTAVKVYPDLNANGQVDAGEQPLSGRFAADNGTLVLNTAQGSSTGLLLDRPAQFLVTVDVAASLAQAGQPLHASAVPGLPAGLAFLLVPLTLLGALRLRSWRAALLAGLLALTLAACGGGSTAPVTKTYQLSLTAVSAKGATSGQNTAVTGLPVQGATLTVQK